MNTNTTHDNQDVPTKPESEATLAAPSGSAMEFKFATSMPDSMLAAREFPWHLAMSEAIHRAQGMVLGCASPPQRGDRVKLTVEWEYGFRGIGTILNVRAQWSPNRATNNEQF